MGREVKASEAGAGREKLYVLTMLLHPFGPCGVMAKYGWGGNPVFMSKAVLHGLC